MKKLRAFVIFAMNHAIKTIIAMAAENSSVINAIKEGWICLSNRMMSKNIRRFKEKKEKRKKGGD